MSSIELIPQYHICIKLKNSKELNYDLQDFKVSNKYLWIKLNTIKSLKHIPKEYYINHDTIEYFTIEKVVK